MALLTRSIDFLKGRAVTTLFTSLDSTADSEGNMQMASLLDTWLLVKTTEGNREFNRILYVRKARGTANSNQIREFLLTANGIELADVYVGAEGVLTGSARQAQEAKEISANIARQNLLEQRGATLERRRASVEVQVADLWRDFDLEADTMQQLRSDGSVGAEDRADQRVAQGRLRHADPVRVLQETINVLATRDIAATKT